MALRKEQGRPYFPSFTGKKTADDYQFNELYESVGPAFDEAVALFSEIAGVSEGREISKSPVAGQLQDILRQDGVEPALSGSMPAQDALDQANEAAQDAIDSF
jgi:ABC-type glycerol-3-phosphate transport system substrate-binding protein